MPGILSDRDLLIRSLSLLNQSESDRFRMSKRVDSYNDFSKIPYETIHRILRDEESPYRTEDHRVHRRWKKSTRSHRRISKRETQINLNSSKNSTKSIDLVNRNLTKFVFDSDLELQFTQSQDVRVMTRLNLTDNRITEFDTNQLNRLPNVEKLDLTRNNLKKFVLGNNSSVKYLKLSENTIANFTIRNNNAKLNILILQNNNINSSESNSFDLSDITELETLDLSCNEIQQVNRKIIGHGTALKRLNLARNRINRIGKNTFENLMNIETLILSYNNISTIDPETFLHLPNLQYLDLSYNNIRAQSIRSLQGIPDLVGLSIAHNPDLGESLQEFVASWSLKELDASGTGLCRIPSALAQSVRTLILIENWFEVIRCGDLDSYPLLQYLDLSQSHITEIEDDALGRLEILQTLFLDHNSLKRIPISLPTSLENLFLHSNEIMDIQPLSLQQLTNLKTLDLSRNKLTYVPGLPLPKLLVLNLQSSELRGLSQSVVKTSPKLRDLLLDGNPIKCTELMGIAEWATPCEDDRMPAKLKDIKRRFIEMHNYLKGFPTTEPQDCPGVYVKADSEYKKRPSCAGPSLLSRNDVQSNKLESQFNKTNENELNTKAPQIYRNQNEDIENSIQIQRLTSHKSYDDKSGNSLAVNSISGKAVIITNSQSLSAVPNDIKIHDRLINSLGNGSFRRAKMNPLNKENTRVRDAKTPIPIGSQSQHNLNGSNAIFTKSKKNIKRKQPQQQEHQDLILSQIKSELTTQTTEALISVQVSGNTSNGFLNTSEPEAAIAHHNKLDRTELSLLVEKHASTTRKYDSISDKRSTTKTMMLETLQELSTQTPPPSAENTSAILAHDSVLNNKTILAILVSFAPSSETPTTRIPSPIISSKVNKAEKVDDHQPSAINENGINKRNHSAPYNHPQSSVEVVSKRKVNEKLLVLQTKFPSSRRQENKRYNHDESQQNRPPFSASKTTTTSKPQLTSIKPRKPDKVEPDTHLKFIAERKLNITVLTYTRKHILKTVNKDISPQHQTPLIFEMETSTEPVLVTDFYPNIQANYFKGENHFTVNTNRVSTNMNNNHNDPNKAAQGHPQLNALHALSPHHLNSSNNSFGSPPEHWLDIRTATGHPGLFIVIGLTIGTIFTLGLLHIYRCRRPGRRNHRHQVNNPRHPRDYSNPCSNPDNTDPQDSSPRRYSNNSYINCDEDAGYYIEPDQYQARSVTRRDFLPMELLRSSAGQQFPDNNHQPIW